MDDRNGNGDQTVNGGQAKRRCLADTNRDPGYTGLDNDCNCNKDRGNDNTERDIALCKFLLLVNILGDLAKDREADVSATTARITAMINWIMPTIAFTRIIMSPHVLVFLCAERAHKDIPGYLPIARQIGGKTAFRVSILF